MFMKLTIKVVEFFLGHPVYAVSPKVHEAGLTVSRTFENLTRRVAAWTQIIVCVSAEPALFAFAETAYGEGMGNQH